MSTTRLDARGSRAPRRLRTSRTSRTPRDASLPAFCSIRAFIARACTTCAAVSLILAASACSVLPPADQVDTYRLPSVPLPAYGAGGVVPRRDEASTSSVREGSASLLAIAPITSGRYLDGDRIAVIPSGDLLSAYRGARWGDRVPSLLRARLVQAFADDGRLTVFAGDEGAVRASRELDADLLAFQAEYPAASVTSEASGAPAGPPVVKVALEARLVDVAGRCVLRAGRFEVTRPARTSAVPAVVSAFGAAADELSARLVAWTTRSLTDPAARTCRGD